MNAPHRIRRIKKFRIQQSQRECPCRSLSVFSIIQRLVYSFRAYLPFFQLNEVARPIKSAHISCDLWTIDDSVKKPNRIYSWFLLLIAAIYFLDILHYTSWKLCNESNVIWYLAVMNCSLSQNEMSRYYIFALCRE